MTDDSGDGGEVSGYTFPAPHEAQEYWTPERLAAARPRDIRLDGHGRRLPHAGDADEDPIEEGDTPSV